MIDPRIEAEILRLYHVEKWKRGTIATQLGVHHDAVDRVLSNEGVPRPRLSRPSKIDEYLPFILETLRRHPKLTASRLFDMCTERGYRGSPDHFRHMVARYRPGLWPRRTCACARCRASRPRWTGPTLARSRSDAPSASSWPS